MQQHQLGSVGPVVSAMGLGCMGMSEFYGDADDAKSIQVIHRALDIGVNFLDTANIYGPFTNEVLVGKAIASKDRDSIILATKFGIVREPGSNQGRGICGKPEYVQSSCEDSLKRLNVDTIDLYYQHRVDPQVPIEDTVGAMARLVEQGKVRYLGLSEAGPATLRKAYKVHPITALQTEYSLWSRDPEDDILATCRELGIGFVAYSPLGRGFLAGRFKSLDDLAPDDWRRSSPRFQGENFQKNLDLVTKVHDLAATKKVTPSQLALAWVMAQGQDIVPIPGTKHQKYLEENAAAVECSLTEEDLAALDAIAPRGAAAGTRYTAEGMQAVGR